MNNINVWPAFKSKAITKNTAYNSPVLDLGPYELNGFFSAHVFQADDDGDARIKLQWGVSNTGADLVYSADAGDDIITAHSSAAGPGTDGNMIYSFDPITARYLQIKATETANDDTSIVISVYIAMH